MDGARRPVTTVVDAPAVPFVPVADVDTTDLAIPPIDLLPAEQAFWRLYATAAVEQRTLVPSTVIGFRELCEQFALKQALAMRINKYALGAGSKSAEGPLRAYVKLAQRIDATLARFKLTAFGKPADVGAAKTPAANPWALVAAK